MAKEMKDRGIKNYKFILKLYDEKLQGVDPHDKNLSLEMQARIQREVTINYWYYIRECILIPSTGGNVRYEVHRGNIAATFLQLMNLNTILLLPRQHYKTWSNVAFYSWVYLFAAKNFNIVFSNKQFEDSKLNIKRLKDVINELPEYLRLHQNKKKDTDNVELIRIDSNNNTIKALSTGRDMKSADKLGCPTNHSLMKLCTKN